MDQHERATSVWYRIAGLLRRKEIAIDIIDAEIRSAQHEAFLEAAKLVLTGDPVEIARQLQGRVELTVRPKYQVTITRPSFWEAIPPRLGFPVLAKAFWGVSLLLLPRDVRDTGNMGPGAVKMVILLYLVTILGLGVIGVASKYNLLGSRLARSSVEVKTQPLFPSTPAPP